MKIGIDIGGCHVGIGLVDNNGSIVLKEEMFIKDKTNIKEQIEEYITEKVIQMSLIHNIECVGVSVPGTVSGNKIMKSVNFGIVEEYDLAGNLEKILKMPVKMKNDAKCAALAEQKYGELANYNDSVFFCIGTGVGTAVFQDGKMLEPDNLP